MMIFRHDVADEHTIAPITAAHVKITAAIDDDLPVWSGACVCDNLAIINFDNIRPSIQAKILIFDVAKLIKPFDFDSRISRNHNIMA